VNASLRSLFATGLFADVQIARQGTTVVVTVDENPVISTVAIEGNAEIDTKTLEGEVRLKSRSVYTRSRALADAQRILDVYQRQGRYSATVEPKIIELDQNRVNLVFEINEGSATKVASINFIGNKSFSDSQLRDIISTSQASWTNWIMGGSPYDQDRLRLDQELVRQYYLKNGYADVQVTSANAELDRDGTGFIITFVVDEGPLYRFGSVRIENSLPEFQPESVRAEMLTIEGATFNASDIEKSVEKMTLAASEQGFAFVRIRPRAERDPVGRFINLTYVIDQGPRVYIERIDVVGNVRTKDRVIRREFRLVEGDAFNPLLVDRAEKRIKGLGFFKDAKVSRQPGSAPDRVALVVQVTEQPTGELSFGAGFSTSEGVIGDVSLTERNFMGEGQFLRLKVGGSFTRAQIDLSFTEPRFLDKNISAGFDLFHKEIDLSDTSSYKTRKTGFSPRIGFPLSENIWMAMSYTISRDELFDVEPDASFVIRETAGPDGKDLAYTSAIGLSLQYDTRNHPKNPTRGIFLLGSTDFAGVGGDVQYVRVQGEGRAYYPLFENVTLVGRVVAGHIEGWGGDDVRLLDVFQRGGETIRGFDSAGFGPRDINSVNRDALGGKTYWAANAEVRFPLPLVSESLGMSAAVFADAGSLFNVSEIAENKPGVVDDASIRTSVGASILWNSPLGPLRFDYAFPLQYEDYDELQRFRFGASTKF
ncbi:MAG: outer membrane protein assembly factor BamA, partial [Alphaproteobacteria bacterium]|nr:outer membrane protein assembly factor BamA [Alphaproteobacteria bacterium]